MAERSTLAERMLQARDRTVAARSAAAGTGASRPGPGPSPGHGAGANTGGWIVGARPGEQVMLMPGQMHFGAQAAGLRTLLGSCVAVTLWHPRRKLGGMCHFLLPSRPRKPGDPLDGRYGDEAMEAMLKLLLATGTEPSEFHAHLCGGADTMPEGSALKFNVGERNIEQGFTLADKYGFDIQGVDVGEDVPRTVTLALASGVVDMKRGAGRAPVLNMQAGVGGRSGR
jgi:chemotaxis protein CheD